MGVYRSVCLAVTVLAFLSLINAQKYEPTWESLDKRPIPAWYDESKFGIFLHWGVFSVPSFGSEWFWERWQEKKVPKFVEFMEKNYAPNFQYPDFAPMFTAEFYNPKEWADIFKASGAKYVVLTSKHHEGFCNWPTKHSWNWNSMETGPHRDLIGDLAAAIRNRTDIHFGLYHSLFEWFNPLYLQDKASDFKTQTFVKEKTMPELYELVNAYKPEVVWSDGCAGPADYWNSTHFLAWLYNESPVKDTVVTNDRWGNDHILCHHGGVYTCKDRYNPGVVQPHKWENCMTIDTRSWGYRREALLSDYLSISDLISSLSSTVSCGGNLLLNVGPTHDGRIAPIFEERLRQMGQWLNVNGEAIYGTRPWTHQNDTVTKNVWYTSKAGSVYAIVLDWPHTDVLTLGAVQNSSSTTVTMLGCTGTFSWTPRPTGGIDVHLPVIPSYREPTPWAKVLKLTNLANR